MMATGVERGAAGGTAGHGAAGVRRHASTVREADEACGERREEQNGQGADDGKARDAWKPHADSVLFFDGCECGAGVGARAGAE